MKYLQKWSFELDGLSWVPKAEHVGPGDRQGPVGHDGRWEPFPKRLPGLGSCFPQPCSFQGRANGDPQGDVTAWPQEGAGTPMAG